MPTNLAFASLASANGACLAREILARDEDYLNTIANFDGLNTLAVRMAEVETAKPLVWEDTPWEDVCSALAEAIVVKKEPVSDRMLARAMKLRRLPASISKA